MNTPIPHIGATLTSRRAIRAYAEAQREAIHHAERQAMRQPEPVNFCAPVEDVPPPLWLVAVGSSLWTLLLVIGLVLAADQLGWLS